MVDPNVLAFGLQLAIIGMGVVFTALVLVVGTLSLLARFDPWLSKAWEAAEHGGGHGHGEAESPAPVTVVPVNPLHATEAHGELAPELVAALTAAVTVAIGKKVRIQRVRYRAARPTGTWSQQGRATIMTTRRSKH
ncbi:MAG TPA: OadG family protein [Anaerolineae bacterium]|nr:OadG family protein [Anaerolineae bacterium]